MCTPGNRGSELFLDTPVPGQQSHPSRHGALQDIAAVPTAEPVQPEVVICQKGLGDLTHAAQLTGPAYEGQYRCSLLSKHNQNKAFIWPRLWSHINMPSFQAVDYHETVIR